MKALTYAEQFIAENFNKGTPIERIVPYITNTVYFANKNAMVLLESKEAKVSLKLLHYAEKLLNDFKCKQVVSLIHLTLNNLACIHKKHKKPLSALKYLREGMKICKEFKVDENVAIARLNLCAILSQLNKHKEAYKEALKAVNKCNKDLKRINDSSSVDTEQTHKEYIEKLSLLAIAYYNLGVQEEFMQNFNESFTWYKKACSTIEGNMEIDMKLKCSFYTALKKVSEKMKRNKRFSQSNIKPTSIRMTQSNILTPRTTRQKVIVITKRQPLSARKPQSVILNNRRTQSRQERTASNYKIPEKIFAREKLNTSQELGFINRHVTDNIMNEIDKLIDYKEPIKEHNDSFEEHRSLKELGVLNWSPDQGTRIASSRKRFVIQHSSFKAETNDKESGLSDYLRTNNGLLTDRVHAKQFEVEVDMKNNRSFRKVSGTRNYMTNSKRNSIGPETNFNSKLIKPKNVIVLKPYQVNSFYFKSPNEEKKTQDAIEMLEHKEVTLQDDIEVSDSPYEILQDTPLDNTMKEIIPSPIPAVTRMNIITSSITEAKLSAPKIEHQAATTIQNLYRKHKAKKVYNNLLSNCKYITYFRSSYISTSGSGIILIQHSKKDDKVRVILEEIKSYSTLYLIELTVAGIGQIDISVAFKEAWEGVNKSGNVSKDSLQFYDVLMQIISNKNDDVTPKFAEPSAKANLQFIHENETTQREDVKEKSEVVSRQKSLHRLASNLSNKKMKKEEESVSGSKFKDESGKQPLYGGIVKFNTMSAKSSILQSKSKEIKEDANVDKVKGEESVLEDVSQEMEFDKIVETDDHILNTLNKNSSEYEEVNANETSKSSKIQQANPHKMLKEEHINSSRSEVNGEYYIRTKGDMTKEHIVEYNPREERKDDEVYIGDTNPLARTLQELPIDSSSSDENTDDKTKPLASKLFKNTNIKRSYTKQPIESSIENELILKNLNEQSKESIKTQPKLFTCTDNNLATNPKETHSRSIAKRIKIGDKGNKKPPRNLLIAYKSDAKSRLKDHSTSIKNDSRAENNGTVLSLEHNNFKESIVQEYLPLKLVNTCNKDEVYLSTGLPLLNKEGVKTLHTVIKFINEQRIELKLIQILNQQIELIVKNNENELTVALKPYIEKYLSGRISSNKQYAILKLIANSFIIDSTDRVMFDESIISNFIYKERCATRIQTWFRKLLAINKLKALQCNYELLMQEGVNLNGKYQLIRIMIDKRDRNTIRISSSRSTTDVKTKFSNLLKKSLWENVMNDSNELKKILRNSIPKILTYDYNTKKITLKLKPKA